MSDLGDLLSLEYGEPLPSEIRTGYGYPVFGSNGEVGRHDSGLIEGPGIIVGRKGSAGKVCWTDESFWPIDTTYWVKCESGDQRWLYWLLSYLPLDRLGSSTGVPGLNRNDAYTLRVFEPPGNERRKISMVLDTLETTVRKTEAIIEKLKQVKQGLLHDLLTRGIGANGELRPPQSEAPHLYKDSPVGWVPIEWQVQRMANYMATEITYGIVQAGPHIDGGIPYVRTGDMSGDSLCKVSMLCTTRRIADAFRRSEVRSGDIVMAIRATVGKVLMVPNELSGANLTQGTARLAPNKQSDPEFLLWAIRHERAQNSIASEIKGTTFAEITLAALREVLLAAPVHKDEQIEIGKRMAACESRIFQECRNLEKLKAQKSGVMDDLLTGRVRVTPLLNSQVA